MKINKDLAEALLMLSFIILVLISTTDFDNAGTKTTVMVSLGAMCVITLVLRVLAVFQKKKEE